MFLSPKLAAWVVGGLLAVGAAAGLPARAAEPSSRPVVLVVHGRGMNQQDTTVLRRAWLDALNRGLASTGGSLALEEGDLRLVWYADALDPRAPASCTDGRDGGVGTPLELTSVFSAVALVLSLASDLSGEYAAEPLREIAGDLLYFGDPGKRCAAEQRVARALEAAAGEGRPVVLVAHSFGSLVSYHHLRNREAELAPRIERFVTIGSLVGRPELRQLLLGAPGRHTGLPAGVGSWVNVSDPRDPFAAPLRGVRPEPGREASVADRVTERIHGGDPHDAGRYLADPATARAILEGWCAGLRAAGGAEPSCPPASPSG